MPGNLSWGSHKKRTPLSEWRSKIYLLREMVLAGGWQFLAMKCAHHTLFAEHTHPQLKTPVWLWVAPWIEGANPVLTITSRVSVTGGCGAAVCRRSQWAAPCQSQLLPGNPEMDVNSPSCSRNLSLSEPARRSMAEHVAPLLKQILERAARTKGRRYVRRHMEEDIAGDMAGDAPLEGEAPCQSRDTPEGLCLWITHTRAGTPAKGLQPVGGPCQS